jgi:hypothetical protein
MRGHLALPAHDHGVCWLNDVVQGLPALYIDISINAAHAQHNHIPGRDTYDGEAEVSTDGALQKFRSRQASTQQQHETNLIFAEVQIKVRHASCKSLTPSLTPAAEILVDCTLLTCCCLFCGYMHMFSAAGVAGLTATDVSEC